MRNWVTMRLMQAKLCLITAIMGTVVPLAAGLGGCTGGVEYAKNYDGGGGEGGEGYTSSTGPIWDAGKDAFDEYIDPGCPDNPPPVENFTCDPNNQANSGCHSGEGCYIYVQYPTETCGQEEYGAFCAPAGIGTQGTACNGALDCSAGFACVVTGSGTQCVKLCPLQGNDDCPTGLVCEPIDVEGFGGCL